MHAHLGTADHQRVAHVVARVSHIDELFAAKVAKMLTDRQKIGKDLRRVEFVREAVVDGHARVAIVCLVEKR